MQGLSAWKVFKAMSWTSQTETLSCLLSGKLRCFQEGDKKALYVGFSVNMVAFLFRLQSEQWVTESPVVSWDICIELYAKSRNLLLVSPGVSELQRNSKNYGEAGELRMPFFGMGGTFYFYTYIGFSFSFATGEAVRFSSDTPMLFFHFVHTGKWFRVSTKTEPQVRKDLTFSGAAWPPELSIYSFFPTYHKPKVPIWDQAKAWSLCIKEIFKHPHTELYLIWWEKHLICLHLERRKNKHAWAQWLGLFLAGHLWGMGLKQRAREGRPRSGVVCESSNTFEEVEGIWAASASWPDPFSSPSK